MSSYYTYVLGEGAVALRAFLPNEQSWVLTLLHTVIQPKLLGTHTMHRVVLGISDQAFYYFHFLFALTFYLAYYYFFITLLLILTRTLTILLISPYI